MQDDSEAATPNSGRRCAGSYAGGGSGSEHEGSLEDLEVVCEVPPLLIPAHGSVGFISALGEFRKQRLRGVQSSPHDLYLKGLGGLDGGGQVQGLPTWVCQTSSGGAGAGHGRKAALGERGLGEAMLGARRRHTMAPRVLYRTGTAPSTGLRHDALPGCEEDVSLNDVGGEHQPPTMRDLGLPGLLRRRESSVNLLAGSDVFQVGSQSDVSALPSTMPSRTNLSANAMDAVAAQARNSILDFEHLFAQYFVEARLRWRCGWWPTGLGEDSPIWRRLRRLRRRRAAPPAAQQPSRSLVASTMPGAHELAEEYKSAAVDYVWKHRSLCLERWPQLKLSKRALQRALDAELVWHDELQGPMSRVTLTLEPERIFHRLLWAIGDAEPPAQILSEVQDKLRDRFPQCHIRCADSILNPPSVFRTMFFIFTVLSLLSLWVLWSAGLAVYEREQLMASLRRPGRKLPAIDGPTYEELLDQLSARLLLAGSVAQIWLLDAVATAFPLRSLHSPFRRDLGCLAAYSPTALWLCRLVGPAATLTCPAAAAVRFKRLGLLSRGALGWHWAVLACSASLPLWTGAAAWSVRSSLYSSHHLFIMGLFVCMMGAAVGFTAYFEMVKWAVFAAMSLVCFALYMLVRYSAEFTSVRLLKAAQLQWACAHCVPLLGLLLSAALEVESGAARFLVDFICENQDVIPTKMCIRMLRDTE